MPINCHTGIGNHIKLEVILFFTVIFHDLSVQMKLFIVCFEKSPFSTCMGGIALYNFFKLFFRFIDYTAGTISSSESVSPDIVKEGIDDGRRKLCKN